MPTRVDGDRCIDYAITNNVQVVKLIGFDQAVISDHFTLKFEITPCQNSNHRDRAVLRQSAAWIRPDHVSRERWQDALEAKWNALPAFPPPQATCQAEVNALWENFSNRLEDVLASVWFQFQPSCSTDVLNTHEEVVSYSFHSFTVKRRLRKNRLHLVKTSSPFGARRAPGSTFRERKLAHVVGRLAEMLQLEKRNLAHSQGYHKLAQKVSQTMQLPQGTTRDKLLYARAQLSQHRTDQNQHNLEAWRTRLRNSPKECYKWLQNSKVITPVHLQSNRVPHLGVSQCTEEALDVLRCHWRTVWDRPIQLEESLRVLSAEFDQSPAFDLQPLTGNDLKLMASKQHGRAASCDGWYGSELAELPNNIFDHVAKIFIVFENLGLIPDTWTFAKQTHIPKEDLPPSTVDSLDAAKLRPITVLSSWWRLWGAARLQGLQPWLTSWWPSSAFGGCSGSEVYDCLARFDELCTQGEYLVSLDFSLAFDHLHPELALHAFEASGLPPNIVNMIRCVWGHQQRILIYGQQAHPTPQLVQTSVPQGDCWSLYGLCLVLKFPARAIQQQYPRVKQYTFVDDRTLISPALTDLLHAKHAWQTWSARLGMVENQAKEVHFHHHEKGRKKFLDHNIPPVNISEHPKLLGVELQGAKRRSSTPKEKARLAAVLRCLNRARWLPIPWGKVKEFVATQPITKVSWGWMVRVPPKDETSKIQTAVGKALRESSTASVPLRHVLRGHQLHVRFRILTLNLGAAWRQSRKRPEGEPGRWSQKGWPHALDTVLCEYGWNSTAPWKWEHPDLQVTFSLNRQDASWCAWPKLAHWLRESWRRVLFNEFIRSSRRDASACQHVTYDEQVCKRARAAAASRECFNILSGGHVSPAAYCQMKRVAMVSCPCCQVEDAVPTLQHLLVDCPYFDAFRQQCFPGGVPGFDPIEIRLGWPLNPTHAESLLALHVHIRRHTLQLRWGS